MPSSTVLYSEDQLVVQRGLYEAVNMQFFNTLQEIFESDEWKYQDRPIPRGMLRALCPPEPGTNLIICAFCPDERFDQPGHAIEHIQQHFGLRPFQCAEPNCRKTFLRENELTNHSRTHQAPDPIPCPNGCGSCFSGSKNVARHLRESCHLRN